MSSEPLPKIKLTPKVLEDVNVFSRLVLKKERCATINCFSDPVRQGSVCNPDVPDEKGKKGAGDRVGKDVCGIFHICHCYFGARLGIGAAATDEPDFDKALAFCKGLSWKQLTDAVDVILSGDTPTSNEELQEESKQEEQKAQEVKVTPEKKDESPPEAVSTPEVKEAPKTKAQQSKKASVAIASHAETLGYKPSSMGYKILLFVHKQEQTTSEEITRYIAEAGWKQLAKVEKVIDACIEKGVFVKPDDTHLQLTS